MPQYVYANEIYNSITDLENAVVNMKAKLDNEPCEWCSVRSVNSSMNGDTEVWVTGNLLDNDQLNNLPDDDSRYMISSIIKGSNDLGISREDLLSRINEYRVFYSNYHIVNKYFTYEFDEELQELQQNTFDVTNENMNIYME